MAMTASAACPYASCLDALLQTLYESSIAFGMRKALTTEQGKGEMETHITQLEGNVKDLERQVRKLTKVQSRRLGPVPASYNCTQVQQQPTKGPTCQCQVQARGTHQYTCLMSCHSAVAAAAGRLAVNSWNLAE
jgi:hypothetical protein